MRIGEILTTRKFETQGFGRGKAATFKCKDGHVMAYLYMGTMTQDSAPHWSGDGVLAALGYGPIMTTITQRKLIDALKEARSFLLDPTTGRLDAQVKVDAALLAVENFRAGSAPTVDPILLSAARFDKLMRLLETRIGASLMLEQILGVASSGQPALGSERAALEAIIDAASAK